MLLSMLLVAVLVVTASACADDNEDPGGGGGSLEGVTWVLQRASIDELVQGAPDDARVDLLLEGDQASGTSGCNRYFGPFETDGSAISFGALGGTEMACAEPLMDLEAAYVSALVAVTAHELDGEELVMTGDDVRLAFDAERAPESIPLVGTVWGLEAVGTGGDAVASPVAGTEATLELHDDGSATGSGGCNRFNASYETDGTTIGFGPVASTGMACEPDVMEQEAAVLGALESAATFEIVGDVLTLLDADGGFLVSFRGQA